jgi:hypothetical protein
MPAKKAPNREDVIALVQKLELSNEQSMIGDFVGNFQLDVRHSVTHFLF